MTAEVFLLSDVVMQEILITVVAGFVGRHFTRRFLEAAKQDHQFSPVTLPLGIG